MSEPDRTEQYKYDLAGNSVSRVTDDGLAESYSYNKVDELVGIERRMGSS